MREVYTIREQQALELPLDHMLEGNRLNLYEDIISKGFINAQLTRDKILFRAGSYIGLLPLNDYFALNILPKFPISELSHMLSIGSGGRFVALVRHWQAYERVDASVQSFQDVITDAFLSMVDSAVRQGLYQEYHSHTSSGSTVRGRILLRETISHVARGSKHRVTTVSFIRSPDVPANGLLKNALRCLGELYADLGQVQGRLQRLTEINRLLRAFDEIQSLPRDLVSSASFPSDMELKQAGKAEYAELLSLALLIIQNQGIDLRTTLGILRLPSILINLEDVFENYVREVAKRPLREHKLTTLNGNFLPPVGGAKKLFDESKVPLATPDVVLRDVSESETEGKTMILEVKYKTAISRDDLNQAITYGVSYRAERVLIVRVSKESEGSSLQKMGSIDDREIYEFAFDLNGRLTEQEDLFASEVARLAS